MKKRILNSFIIFIIGISLSAENTKEIKTENSFSRCNEESESQFTNSDIINNSNTKEDIETKINFADSEKNIYIFQQKDIQLFFKTAIKILFHIHKRSFRI